MSQDRPECAQAKADLKKLMDTYRAVVIVFWILAGIGGFLVGLTTVLNSVLPHIK